MNEATLDLLSEELKDIGILMNTCCIWKCGSGLLTELRLEKQRMHSCRFCAEVKRKYGESFCVRHDTSTLAMYLNQKHPRAGLNRCPAGADEYLIPIIISGRILGAVLIGPFQGITHDPELPVWRSELGASLVRLVGKHIAPLCLALYQNRPLLNRENARLSAVLNFMEQHYKEKITLKDAAAQAFLSSSRLAHLFREQYHRTFSEYLIQLRLQNARNLLRTTDLAISDIARDSGFRTRSHFSMIFKKIIGISPWQYKQKIRTEIAVYRQSILQKQDPFT